MPRLSSAFATVKVSSIVGCRQDGEDAHVDAHADELNLVWDAVQGVGSPALELEGLPPNADSSAVST